MRLFLIVLDSVGAGYLPDAGLFGDVGANTLGTLASSPELSIPNLVKMGIGNIEIMFADFGGMEGRTMSFIDTFSREFIENVRKIHRPFPISSSLMVQ